MRVLGLVSSHCPGAAAQGCVLCVAVAATGGGFYLEMCVEALLVMRFPLYHSPNVEGQNENGCETSYVDSHP